MRKIGIYSSICLSSEWVCDAGPHTKEKFHLHVTCNWDDNNRQTFDAITYLICFDDKKKMGFEYLTKTAVKKMKKDIPLMIW